MLKTSVVKIHICDQTAAEIPKHSRQSHPGEIHQPMVSSPNRQQVALIEAGIGPQSSKMLFQKRRCSGPLTGCG